MEHQDR
jgi:hypothetical protein